MNDNSQQPITVLTDHDYEALLKAVSQTALVSVTNAKGDIIYVNDMFVSVSKYSREELIGQNHRILKSGLQQDQLFNDLWKAISSGKPWRGDIKNKAKDGCYYWVDTSIVPILSTEGTPERYVAVRFLITEKKQYEEKLSEQNEEMHALLERVEKEQLKLEEQIHETTKFALAVENTTEHIVITDPEGIILYANHGAEVNTGYTKIEMIGTKAGVLWGRQMESSFYRTLWETIKVQKSVFKGEVTNTRKGGAKYIAYATISPVLNKKNEVVFFVGVERDITKEKEIDRAKTEFVSLASHQLRTPLTTINWYSEMLLSGDAGALNEKQTSYLKEVYTGNQRMVQLVNALLNVSRLDLGTFIIDPGQVHVLDVLQVCLKELQPQIHSKNLSIQEHYDQCPDQYQADEKLLRIIFQNLLSNAVKYTPADGTMTVSLGTKQKGESFGNKNLEAAALTFSVADSGIGIPSEQQGKIFSKLFRADNAKESEAEGTGLGLYIVQSILDQCHGAVWFESHVTKGTTFYITLPLTGMVKKTGEKKLD